MRELRPYLRIVVILGALVASLAVPASLVLAAGDSSAASGNTGTIRIRYSKEE